MINLATLSIESSLDPDIRLRHDKTKTVFSIECKFRSDFFWNSKKRRHEIVWSYAEQFERYREYHKTRNPVLVAIGMGDNPHRPVDIFLIPLSKINTTELTKLELQPYHRSNPKQKISWEEVQTLLSL